MPKPRYKSKSWYIARHRELWTWLAENPGCSKVDWPGWNRFKKIPYVYCFLCEATRKNLNEEIKEPAYKCSACYLDWPGGTCQELWSAWCRATRSSRYGNARDLAREIANLPEKEKEDAT